MGITNTPSTSEISKDEYQTEMDRFANSVKDRRESSVIGITNDILEVLNTSPECKIEFRFRNIHIGDAYVTMEAVCCMLYPRDVCVAYTIKVGKKTEGTKDDERTGQSLCRYTLDVSVYALTAELG